MIWKRLRAFAAPWVANYRRLYKLRSKGLNAPIRWEEGVHGLIADLWLEFDASGMICLFF